MEQFKLFIHVPASFVFLSVSCHVEISESGPSFENRPRGQTTYFASLIVYILKVYFLLTKQKSTGK